MIQAVLRLVAPPELRDEIVDVFRTLIGPTEVSKGCHHCRAYHDLNDDCMITYWVQWDCRHELINHFRSPQFRQLLPYIEMSVEPPQVDISDLEWLGGLAMMVAAIAAEADEPYPRRLDL